MHTSGSTPRTLAVLAGAVVLLVTAVGCAHDSATDSPAGGQRTVRLLTYDAFALPEDAATAFEGTTGATIEVIPAGDSGSMLAGALLTAGAPEADVVFGIDNTIASQVASEPLLEEYTPPAAEALADELSAPPGVAGQLTPIDTSEVCVNVDDDWFAQRNLAPPSTFEDLTAARYADLLAVENPVNSSPGLAFMLATVQTRGPEGFADYWAALADNGVRVAPSWDDAYYNDYSVNGGDRPLVVSYASSPPAEVVFSEGARSEPASSVMEGTCVTQVEYAGVMAGAEEPGLGRELVEFMLDPQWQQALPLTNFVYPVTDVELPEEFRRWAPRPAAPITLDATAVGEQRDEWIEQWRSVME